MLLNEPSTLDVTLNRIYRQDDSILSLILKYYTDGSAQLFQRIVNDVRFDKMILYHYTTDLCIPNKTLLSMASKRGYLRIVQILLRFVSTTNVTLEIHSR